MNDKRQVSGASLRRAVLRSAMPFLLSATMCLPHVAFAQDATAPILGAVVAKITDSLVIRDAGIISVDPRPLGTHGPARQAVSRDQLFSNAQLSNVSRAGKSLAVSAERSQQCKKSSASACYAGTAQLNVFVTIGRPQFRGDSAVVRAEVSTARRDSPPPSGALYEFLLIKRSGTWVITSTRYVAGS